MFMHLLAHAPPDAESALNTCLWTQIYCVWTIVPSKDFSCPSHFLHNVMLKPFLETSYLQVVLSHCSWLQAIVAYEICHQDFSTIVRNWEVRNVGIDLDAQCYGTK